MYDPVMVQPMRDEAVRMGFTELKTAADVEKNLEGAKGTALVFVNSVCGCSAGGARPGLAMALKNPQRPDKLFTVFAGNDKEATEKARSYFLGYAPSSPAIGLLKDGKIVFMLERRNIDGHSHEQIAEQLVSAFKAHC